MAAAGATVVACQPQTVIVKETVQVEKVVKETVQVEKVVKETYRSRSRKSDQGRRKDDRGHRRPAEIKESPLSYGQVAAGKLPRWAKRLPAEPLVWIRGDGFEQEIGTYGGVIQLLGGSTDSPPLPEYMLLLNRYCTGTVPCILKGWEFGSDGQSCTFYMRKGMKWSDGEAFTADDIMYCGRTSSSTPNCSPGRTATSASKMSR